MSDLSSGKCKDCDNWTEHSGRKLCCECRRPKFIMTECAEADCKELFKKLGKAKYCLLHRVRRNTRKAGAPPHPPGIWKGHQSVT